MSQLLIQIKKIAKIIYLIPVKKIRFLRKLDGVWRLKRVYKNSYGKQLNEANPEKFSEFLFCRMIEDVKNGNPTFTRLSDKYLVRDFVSDKIGIDYLITLIWHGDNPRDIPFDKLPSKCIIKTNHGSGRNIVIDGACDRDGIIRQLDQQLSENYYWEGLENQYWDIKPHILIEDFVEDGNSFGMLDYRFFCVGGEPRVIQVDNYAHDINPFDDIEWVRLDVSYRHNFKDVNIPRPSNYGEMLDLVLKLAEGIDFVRVDLYNVKGKIYSGEMTFTPGAGRFQFSPEVWDQRLGEWWRDSK